LTDLYPPPSNPKYLSSSGMAASAMPVRQLLCIRPSIHTALTWCVITAYAKAYDAPWLYGVAALTDVARVGGRNHWFSDTVAGSLPGYAVGDFAWNAHKNATTKFAVTPNKVIAYRQFK
jgi:membrane-associated phospholipid phosphatase